MSFNSIFGLGTHSPDANLKRWFPLLDNAASTTVLDESGNAANGTLTGGDNTSTLSTTGPNNWMPRGLHFNGSDDYVNLGSVGAMSSDNLTLLAFIKNDVDPPTVETATGFGMFGEATGVAANGSHHPYNDGVVYNATWRGTSSSAISRVTCGNPTPSLSSTFRQICVKTTPGASGWKFRIDQSNLATATGITGVYTSGANWYFGRSRSGPAGVSDYWLDAVAAHLAIFNRHLSDAEEAEAFAGPEPVNSVAPVASGTATEGQVLSCTTGTWGLDSPLSGGTNGTITYAYQWTRSNDGSGTGEADIGSATSSTYTLVTADVGKYIRCRVRATNDGGTDTAADTSSNFIGAVAALSTSSPDNFGGKFQRATQRHFGGKFQRAA